MVALAKVRKSSTKVVQVIARIEFKSDSRKVVYKVRSSDGSSVYETCLFNGHAMSCTCPARKPCYHETQLEQIEAERQAQERAAYVSMFGIYD